jgi:hypothetical protein
MMMFWLLAQVVPPCDPLFCGMISFEELPAGSYTYLTWQVGMPVDTVEVSLMRTDFSTFWVEEFYGVKPPDWLDKSAGMGGSFAIQFVPPAGKLWFSVTRTGLGEAYPSLRCYLEGRYIGGMISEWPADATAPQTAAFFFLPGSAKFDQCIIDLNDSDFWLDRIGVAKEPFEVPNRLIPRTKGNR